jgi:ubiquinone/menaquinone biosynthesis C-methylase UbiE
LSVAQFYDSLAPWYHLVYPNWETSIQRQGDALASLLSTEWGPDVRRLLDASIGVGTQSLGLAGHGYEVFGSDISPVAVRRANSEARRRGRDLKCHVADFRALAVRTASFDVVLACDNALPHLLSEAEIRITLTEFLRCLRRRGGCVISLRDYGATPASGTVETKDYGDRIWSDRSCRLRQIWRWRGELYDMAFELVAQDGAGEVLMTTPQTTYFGVEPSRVANLMTQVGFQGVRRVDGCLFQPVLVGTR